MAEIPIKELNVADKSMAYDILRVQNRGEAMHFVETTEPCTYFPYRKLTVDLTSKGRTRDQILRVL